MSESLASTQELDSEFCLIYFLSSFLGFQAILVHLQSQQYFFPRFPHVFPYVFISASVSLGDVKIDAKSMLVDPCRTFLQVV